MNEKIMQGGITIKHRDRERERNKYRPFPYYIAMSSGNETGGGAPVTGSLRAGAQSAVARIYYRDKLGRRRVLWPSTIFRKARRLPPGTYSTVYRAAAARDEVIFGPPLSPGWTPTSPYILQIPWNLHHDDAVIAWAVIKEALEDEVRL
jgi:hypothetical protein